MRDFNDLPGTLSTLSPVESSMATLYTRRSRSFILLLLPSISQMPDAVGAGDVSGDQDSQVLALKKVTF